jgi:hypothetical protein
LPHVPEIRSPRCGLAKLHREGRQSAKEQKSLTAKDTKDAKDSIIGIKSQGRQGNAK